MPDEDEWIAKHDATDPTSGSLQHVERRDCRARSEGRTRRRLSHKQDTDTFCCRQSLLLESRRFGIDERYGQVLSG
jgi:hypothetical protein